MPSPPVRVSRAMAAGDIPFPEEWPSVIAQIPRTCICSWELIPPDPNWHLIALRDGCPWHGGHDLERTA